MTTVYRWRCPLPCGWQTPWKPTEEALRVLRVKHCTERHPGHQWTVRDLAPDFWITD